MPVKVAVSALVFIGATCGFALADGGTSLGTSVGTIQGTKFGTVFGTATGAATGVSAGRPSSLGCGVAGSRGALTGPGGAPDVNLIPTMPYGIGRQNLQYPTTTGFGVAEGCQ
jgi:hypothetical protein